MAVMALDTIVCASLITLKAAVVTLGASLCKDCTMLGGVRPRGVRLVKSNCDLLTEANIGKEGGIYLQLVLECLRFSCLANSKLRCYTPQ